MAMRARIVKPEFFASRSLSRVSIPAAITFQGLWSDADSAGRGVADTRLLKGHIWPLRDEITPAIVSAHLDELSREHITLYEVDGETYYEVRNWEKHQSKAYRTGDAVHPEPPDPATCTTNRAPCTTNLALREGKGREGKKENARSDERTLALQEANEAAGKFWDRYPNVHGRKRGKDKTREKFVTLCLKGHLDELRAGFTFWENQWRDPKNREYVPAPIVWLNKGYWEPDAISGDATAARSWLAEQGRMQRDEQDGTDEPDWI